MSDEVDMYVVMARAWSDGFQKWTWRLEAVVHLKLEVKVK